LRFPTWIHRRCLLIIRAEVYTSITREGLRETHDGTVSSWARYEQIEAIARDISPRVRNQLQGDIEKWPSVKVTEEDWDSHSFKYHLFLLIESELRVVCSGLPKADWDSWQLLEEVDEEWMTRREFNKEDLSGPSPMYAEHSGCLDDETKEVLSRIQGGETWALVVDQGRPQSQGDVDLYSPEQPALEPDGDEEPFLLLEIDGSTRYKTQTMFRAPLQLRSPIESGTTAGSSATQNEDTEPSSQASSHPTPAPQTQETPFQRDRPICERCGETRAWKFQSDRDRHVKSCEGQ
jgi:hypothetical protein